MLIFFQTMPAHASSQWQSKSTAIAEPEIFAVAADPNDAHLLYIGTSRGLYAVTEKQTLQLLRPQGGSGQVNDILKKGQALFVATNEGLYSRQNEGAQWKRIYDASEKEAHQCLAVLANEQGIYLGTQKGLFFQKQGARNWTKIDGRMSKDAVVALAQDAAFVYAATGTEVFQIAQTTREAVPVLSLGVVGGAEETFWAEEAGADQVIRDLKIADGKIAAASTKGIYLSPDAGATWQRLSSERVPWNEVTSLAISDAAIPKVWAGTRKGAFYFDGQRWTPLYAGMETGTVNALAQTPDGNFYAATDRGLFFMPAGEAVSSAPAVDWETVRKDFAYEPRIRDVQALAIDYAEVHPQKIRSWRALAAKRALMPTVSVGLDRSSTDLFHWDTGASPDVLLKGREYLDWDVSVSWDLGDLVWSTDQTTIDSRSKLMVELREDVLDQVTRLYFERRRLQAELLAMQETAPEFRFDKQMRVEELTALIDAFTGGKFSKEIEKRSREKAEKEEK